MANDHRSEPADAPDPAVEATTGAVGADGDSAATAAAREAAPDPEAADPAEASGGASAEEVEALRAEVEQAKDQALRAAAELENVRRRAKLDVEKAHKFALEKFVADLLPLADSLEKSIESGRDVVDDGPARAVVEGVELSVKLMLDILGRHGVERIDPTGEPFDPQYHEAMSMIEQADAAPNSVLFTHQKGYLLNGRLVRAAKVVVARGPAAGVDEKA